MKNELAKKPFKKWDLIIYGIIIIVAIVLFAVVFANTKNPDYSFEVTVDGSKVMVIDLEKSNYLIYDKTIVKTDDGNNFLISSHLGFNLLVVNWEEKSLKITDTDCGLSKECTHMNYKDGIIICAPHKLVIKKVDQTPDPVVG